MLREMAGKRHVREGIGVASIAFSLMAVVSLVSYSPGDPSFSHAVAGDWAVKNAAGIIGAYLADTIVQLFGTAAFAIPVFALSFGISLFWENAKPFAISLIVGVGLFLLSFCALVNIAWTADPLYPEAYGGGFFGYLFAEKFLVRILAPAGASIIALAVLFISVLVTTRMSIGQFLSVMKSVVLKLWGILCEFAPHVLELFQKVREKAVGDAAEKPEKEKEEAKEEPEIPAPPPAPEEPKILKKAEKPQIQKMPEEEFTTKQAKFEFMAEGNGYSLPPLSYLSDPKPFNRDKSDKELLVNSQILTKKLADFGIEGRVTMVSPGPVITQYEFEPASGVKVSRIVGLADDLAMGLRAVSVRILAPVPGKAVVGIEVPNQQVEPVSLKAILTSPQFAESESKLTMALGKDTGGTPVVTNLAAIPHLLVAGATGSGKSVGINAMIMSILYKATPEEVNFIMIDPKMLELSVYDGIPHLIAPVVTNPKKAANALRWAVTEMERRYALLANKGFRNIGGYNDWAEEQLKDIKKKPKKKKEDEVIVQKFDEEGNLIADMVETNEPPKKLPYIVIIIDELADLMMVASKDVEEALARLAQMARASGIHLLLATQRPSVDVLTGLIKANFPARLSYQVTSRIDSRTILDAIGAERLLGKGDLLFLPPGTSRLQRIHGPFVSDDEVKRVVEYLRKQGKPQFNEEILKMQERAEEAAEGGEDMGDDDEFFEQAVEIVALTRQASISYIQRRLKIGYNRAARIIETMEQKGMVGPSDGAKPRQVLIPPPPGRELEDE
ncbi:MAG: DNA translocase FtsK 4TM domain-containing protein [Nitrospinae bacterium]|nr:DNA translocase FtsK 4TM domain-containing protein [Nitrospinota bacterium]